jgi:hypothetical protein
VESKEHEVGKALGEGTSGVTLVCWEHSHIPDIANAIPTEPGTKIPQSWRDNRFDVIFWFSRDDDSKPYAFDQIMQRLFAGEDGNQPIPP